MFREFLIKTYGVYLDMPEDIKDKELYEVLYELSDDWYAAVDPEYFDAYGSNAQARANIMRRNPDALANRIYRSRAYESI